MQIIDFEKFGNVVRFYLGQNGEQWGDDWDDAPYDCNAGTVYDQYVQGTKDIAFPPEWDVLEPCDGEFNCNVTKEDMKKRYTPCIVARKKDDNWAMEGIFHRAVVADGSKRFYFGDDMKPGPMEIWDGDEQNASVSGL